eukprot:3581746-Amphidinium_carterae.1
MPAQVERRDFSSESSDLSDDVRVPFHVHFIAGQKHWPTGMQTLWGRVRLPFDQRPHLNSWPRLGCLEGLHSWWDACNCEEEEANQAEAPRLDSANIA